MKEKSTNLVLVAAGVFLLSLSILIVMYVIKLFADGMMPSNFMMPATFSFLLIALGISLVDSLAKY